MKNLIFVVIAILFASCAESDQQRQEHLGVETLAAARHALMSGNFDEARDSIMSLRKNSPLAFEARKQAILLLDSIELIAAHDSLEALPPSVRQLHITTPTTQDAIDVAKGNLPLVDEYERLLVKIRFYEQKLLKDQGHSK